jgi:hypothetical protein
MRRGRCATESPESLRGSPRSCDPEGMDADTRVANIRPPRWTLVRLPEVARSTSEILYRMNVPEVQSPGPVPMRSALSAGHRFSEGPRNRRRIRTFRLTHPAAPGGVDDSGNPDPICSRGIRSLTGVLGTLVDRFRRPRSRVLAFDSLVREPRGGNESRESELAERTRGILGGPRPGFLGKKPRGGIRVPPREL